ncbi:MAG: DUF3024 domain-containing protein [Nitrososphaera sp.]|nr:DUF3024 domain-containing protein [Nitrososphaera sp.]
MALPSLLKQLVESRLQTYCDNRVPAHVKDKLKISFGLRGNSVTIYEERPYFLDKTRWTKGSVAQLRFSPTTGKWTLYCCDRNRRWHQYSQVRSTQKLDVLLKAIDDDVTGIFWG